MRMHTSAELARGEAAAAAAAAAAAMNSDMDRLQERVALATAESLEWRQAAEAHVASKDALSVEVSV